MSPKRHVLAYLTDIMDAIDAAHSFVIDMDVTQFRVDRRTVYAITHALEIVARQRSAFPSRYVPATRRLHGA